MAVYVKCDCVCTWYWHWHFCFVLNNKSTRRSVVLLHGAQGKGADRAEEATEGARGGWGNSSAAFFFRKPEIHKTVCFLVVCVCVCAHVRACVLQCCVVATVLTLGRLSIWYWQRETHRGDFGRQTQGADNVKLTEVIMVDRCRALTMWNSQKWLW